MRDIFHFQENRNYNFSSSTHLTSKNMRIKLFRKETVSNLRAKILFQFPDKLKNAYLCKFFKNKMNKWKSTN